MSSILEMREAAEKNEWARLTQVAEEAIAARRSPDVAHFFLSIANRKLGRISEALTSASRGLDLSPGSAWGVSVYYDACKAAGCVQVGLDRLQDYLEKYPDSPQVRHLLVDQAAEAGKFDLATSFYAELSNASKTGLPASKAIVIQCFAKPDTVEAAITRLLSCEGRKEWNVIIFQDGIEGNERRQKYDEHHKKTASVINNYSYQLTKQFASVTYVTNDISLGTTTGCQVALDFAFASNDYAVLLEDDCEFEPSALSWFDFARSLLGEEVWFAAGESIFFNPGARKASEAEKINLIKIAEKYSLGSKYTEIKFVPSSCFATLRETWNKVRLIRGLPRGDENLSNFLERSGGRTVMPMVPLVLDKGMLHEQGYSVVTLGKQNVREMKSHISVGVSFKRREAKRFSGDLGLMQRATCLLEQSALSQLISQEHPLTT